MKTIAKSWRDYNLPVDASKWRKQRYGEYYNTVVALPLHEREWAEYLKRIKVFKKQLNKLGPVPAREAQLISTVQYFVKIVNLATSFVDKGLIKWAPESKADIVSDFNDSMITVTRRNAEAYSSYINKAKVGENVTTDNLFIGMSSEIQEEDIKPNMKIKKYKERFYNIDVEMAPISDWINRRVRAVDGTYAQIKQKSMALLCNKLVELLNEVISRVEEE